MTLGPGSCIFLPCSDSCPLAFLGQDDVKTALRDQLAYYFSAHNLIKDRYLLTHMQFPQMWTSIQLIANFRGVKVGVPCALQTWAARKSVGPPFL